MRKKLILCFVLFFCFTQSQAQFLDRLKKRIERSVEETVIRKAERKAEEKTSEAFDDVVEGSSKKEKTQNKNKTSTKQESTVENESLDKKDEFDISNMFGGSKDDTPDRIYQFDGAVTFDVNMDNNNMTYEFLYSKLETYYGMYIDMGKKGSSGTNITVLDGDNVASYINSGGMKMKMTSMGGMMDKIKDQAVKEDEMASVIKTGNTKTILGYRCDEYILTKDDVKIISFITKDLDIPNLYFESKEDSAIQGFVLEYTADTKDGKLHVIVTSIDENKKTTLNTSEYKSMF